MLHSMCDTGEQRATRSSGKKMQHKQITNLLKLYTLPNILEKDTHFSTSRAETLNL